ncbi:protein phosphatase 2C, partial [Tanacetum coccineum]
DLNPQPFGWGAFSHTVYHWDTSPLVVLLSVYSIHLSIKVFDIDHAGSAKRLVKLALQEAAKKREMRYSDLKKIDRGVRRHFHDDITVVVLFLDANLMSRASSFRNPNVSVKGAGVHLPSNTLAPCSTPTETSTT